MKSVRLRQAIAIAAVLAALTGIAPAAQAATTSPVSVLVGDLQASKLVPVLGRLPQLLAGSTDLGRALASDPARALIALKPRDEAALDRFISRVSNPASRGYRHYLTPAQYTSRFAPTAATVQAVETWARAAGMRLAEVPADRQYVYVTGTVAAAERAFGVRLERYLVGGASVQAPSGSVRLPAALAGKVSVVRGLNTADVMRPSASPPAAYVDAPPCSPYFGQPSSAPAVYGSKTSPPLVPCGYTPQQLRIAYGLQTAVNAGITGAGVTVAVIDAYSSPLLVSDVGTWSANHGLPAPNLEIDDTDAQRNAFQMPPLLSGVPTLLGELPIEITGVGSYDPQGWAGEETLDVEAIHGIAPGAKLIFQGANSDNNLDLTRAQNQVVQNNKAQIISNSYGAPADIAGPDSDAIWKQAAAQGIGVYFASGDNGDETKGSGAATQRQTDGGANSPFVTAVGGTTLGIGPTGKYNFETYWGVYTDPLVNGAYSQPLPGTFLYGGGGGTSEVYAQPSWQTSVVPQRFSGYWHDNAAAIGGAQVPGRVVPDVAVDGDPATGLDVGMVQDFDAYMNTQFGATSSDKDMGYAEFRIGGTSLSSPLFAAMMALADQAAGARHGFANPALYAASPKKAYHDIKPPATTIASLRTDYANKTNAANGTTEALRTTGQTVSLTSAAGYDDSTGLGSPRGLAFLHAMAPNNKLVSKLLKKYGS